jgi:hypothetical protein
MPFIPRYKMLLETFGTCSFECNRRFFIGGSEMHEFSLYTSL